MDTEIEPSNRSPADNCAGILRRYPVQETHNPAAEIDAGFLNETMCQSGDNDGHRQREPA